MRQSMPPQPLPMRRCARERPCPARNPHPEARHGRSGRDQRRRLAPRRRRRRRGPPGPGRHGRGPPPAAPGHALREAGPLSGSRSASCAPSCGGGSRNGLARPRLPKVRSQPGADRGAAPYSAATAMAVPHLKDRRSVSRRSAARRALASFTGPKPRTSSGHSASAIAASMLRCGSARTSAMSRS